MIKHRCKLSFLTLFIWISACTESTPEPAGQDLLTPKVLVIGIDGIRPDILMDVNTPHIDRLAAEGLLTNQAMTGYPSVSGPGWSSMLNGVWPDKHGVTDNSFDGERYNDFPDFLTRIEQIRPELETFAVADWAPLGYSDQGSPTISDAVDVKHVLDGYELGWAEADAKSVQLAVEQLETSNPDALFVYLGNPDEISHEHSSIGSEYRDAIALADEHVGVLVKAIHDRVTYPEEDWLILSSTDHGRRSDGGHGGNSEEERTIYFLANGPSVIALTLPDSIYIVDVAVTALTHLKIQIDPSWRLDGNPVGILR